MVIVGDVFLLNLSQSVTDRIILGPISSTQRKVSIIARAQATGRCIFYRRFTRPPSIFGWSAYEMSAFMLIIFVFLTALIFSERPYYRQQLGHGSRPIAIRCGLMTFACVLILVALAGKANIITFSTGIGYEKLNVLHRWVTWFSFVLRLIHSLPCFYQSLHD